MARRRVFRTRVDCPGFGTDAVGITELRTRLLGRAVMLDRSSSSKVNLILDGTAVGQIDARIGHQIASAIDRGQAFTAIVENAFLNYEDTRASLGNSTLKLIGSLLDIRVEYLLEKGQPAIEVAQSSASESQSYDKSFFTKVAGVSHEGRQQIIKRCSVGERLILVREPDNPFDNGAIKVLRSNGEQLGYIPAHVSRGDDPSGLAYDMDHGRKYQCWIKDITGGDGGKIFGVNIEINEISEQKSYEAVVQRRLNELATKRSDDVPLMNKPHHNYAAWLIVLALAVVLYFIIIEQNC